MKTSKFTDEQIAIALRQAEAGTAVGRKLGVSEQSFYRWKKQFGTLGVSELRELRQLGPEGRAVPLVRLVPGRVRELPVGDGGLRPQDGLGLDGLAQAERFRGGPDHEEDAEGGRERRWRGRVGSWHAARSRARPIDDSGQFMGV